MNCVPREFRKEGHLVKFVEGCASRISVPAGARDVLVFDDALPGFFIRKFESGKASYGVKFNVGSQQRRMALGAVVPGVLGDMRKKAADVLARARLGQDVVADKRAAAGKHSITLGGLVPRYLAARKTELRPKSHIEATRYLEQHWRPLHKRPVDGITRSQIVAVLDDLEASSGKVAADRARTTLSAMFAWCIDRGQLDANPCLNIRARAQGKSRERVLTEPELAAVWNACRDDDHGRIVQLLTLTGQRRAEIGDLRWSEIDLRKREIALPAARTKNNRPHVVPLSDEAIAILKAIPRKTDRDLVFGTGIQGFSAWSKSKRRLDERLPGMMPWTVHDLRRSFVTLISEDGFALPHVVEAIVNHVSGSKAGVAGVYNRATYLNEKRQALEMWGAHIAALVSGRRSKVVPISARR
jgi:integrase